MSSKTGFNGSEGISVSVDGTYGVWGPYANKNNSNIKDCYVQVVKRGNRGNPLYKDLDEEFLVGVNLQGHMRFICDMPDHIAMALSLYKMAHRNTAEKKKAEQYLNQLNCLFDEVVEKFG